MSEPVFSLPTDHAFVLQLQENWGRPGAFRAGRIEHLASGQATRFTTTTEVWDFVNTVLTAVTQRREQDLRRGSSSVFHASREGDYMEDDSCA